MENKKANVAAKYESNRSNKPHYIYFQHDTNLSFGIHLHSSFEILYLEKGSLITTIGNKSISLKEGDTAIILPNQIHSYRTRGDSKSTLVIFSQDWIPSYGKAVASKQYENPVVSYEALPLLKKIESEKNHFLLKGYLYELVGEIDKHCVLSDSSYRDGSILEKMSDYVKNNYMKDISLESMARDTGYSYNYLSSIFNANFGINFSRYVNCFRIEEAAYLLSTGEEEITDIALECGFNNIRSFNRAFLDLKGVTPREFRKSGSAY
ncbi:MAG: AraC family transcriptional regulator [Bacilli bacterium]|jgi:AraC-like DNA-binding protein/mannose-6-phosphate isomerase-like protein (cupin superfamily)|nr:AraC family transcriptional regulator [Bacilli bacterium]